MYNLSQNNTGSEHYRTHQKLMKDRQSDISNFSILPLSRDLHIFLAVKPVYSEVLHYMDWS